jgi:predicted nucleic acid-binding protein
MRVLFDTNVILDVMLERMPFYGHSALALNRASKADVEGFISGHAVPTIYYIAAKTMSAKDVRLILGSLLSELKVAAVTEKVIRQALSSTLKDFEDAITHAAAEECQASLIVTRNIRDFARGTLQAVLPEVFLQIGDQ